MRNGNRARQYSESEVDQEDVLRESLPDSVYRTRAVFDAETLLQKVAAGERVSKLDARAVLEHYPTKLELMRLAESCPMLDAREAQRLGDARERLDV